MDLNSKSTQFFLASLFWQDNKDVEVVIADGGSDNYKELCDYANLHIDLHMRVISHPIGDAFLRALLNNVGVRHSKGEYILATDADMIFRRDFTKVIIQNTSKDCILESRTFHMTQRRTNEIHNGIIDPYANFDDCKIGSRGTGRFTGSPGGCQCMHRDNWDQLRGYNEKYIGWGSEDRDLLKRAKLLGLKEKWTGKIASEGMILHQWHYQDMKRDLAFQESNKKILEAVNVARVNQNGWGGITSE